MGFRSASTYAGWVFDLDSATLPPMSRYRHVHEPCDVTRVAYEDSALSGMLADAATDLVKKPGQRVLLTLDDLFSPFRNFRGEQVVDFRRPRAHLRVMERRMAGWPTIEDTRIPYDNIANLVSTGEIGFDQVAHFYPDVSADAARDALSLQQQVDRVIQPAGAV